MSSPGGAEVEGPQGNSSKQGEVRRLHEVFHWCMCGLVSHDYAAIPGHKSSEAGRDHQHRPQVRQQLLLCVPACFECVRALLEQRGWSGLALCWFGSSLQH